MVFLRTVSSIKENGKKLALSTLSDSFFKIELTRCMDSPLNSRVERDVETVERLDFIFDT